MLHSSIKRIADGITHLFWYKPVLRWMHRPLRHIRPSFDLSRDSGKLLGSRLGAKEELENDFHVGRGLSRRLRCGAVGSLASVHKRRMPMNLRFPRSVLTHYRLEAPSSLSNWAAMPASLSTGFSTGRRAKSSV